MLHRLPQKCLCLFSPLFVSSTGVNSNLQPLRCIFQQIIMWHYAAQYHSITTQSIDQSEVVKSPLRWHHFTVSAHLKFPFYVTLQLTGRCSSELLQQLGQSPDYGTNWLLDWSSPLAPFNDVESFLKVKEGSSKDTSNTTEGLFQCPGSSNSTKDRVLRTENSQGRCLCFLDGPTCRILRA